LSTISEVAMAPPATAASCHLSLDVAVSDDTDPPLADGVPVGL
jgi:hypothetical protein